MIGLPTPPPFFVYCWHFRPSSLPARPPSTQARVQCCCCNIPPVLHNSAAVELRRRLHLHFPQAGWSQWETLAQKADLHFSIPERVCSLRPRLWSPKEHVLTFVEARWNDIVFRTCSPFREANRPQCPSTLRVFRAIHSNDARTFFFKQHFK